MSTIRVGQALPAPSNSRPIPVALQLQHSSTGQTHTESPQCGSRPDASAGSHRDTE